MTGPGAEMPFLEHLEELRVRLLRALLALVAGFAAGFWLVQRFQLVALLKRPIAPYLGTTGGKLTFTSPTEPVFITLKLAFVVGVLLASPVILYQAWRFLAPALYERERRVAVPALLAGLLFFVAGGVFGWLLVPQALEILFSFQNEGLTGLITYEKYFNFVLAIVLAMGVCFEVPLVMMLLAALGVVTPAGFNRFRRFAIVLAAVAGAVLSPGTDVISMAMMTIPLLLLYELGGVGAWIIHRRRVRRAAAAGAALVLLAVLAIPAPLEAQQPTVPRPGVPAADALRRPTAGDTAAGPDSLRPRPGQAMDTAAARRLGLPTGPRWSFAPNDSVLEALLARTGYEATRYRADSATLFAAERRIYLRGEAMTRRGETTLEADTIAYSDRDDMLRAVGNPALFDRATVLTGGGGIRYDTRIRRGVVLDALTSFKQGTTDWFLHGNLAQDSSASRLYAAHGEITSCDLPTPHYHFAAKEVKWISRTIMVARPAVLYVRDVPILWLPFVFQDGRSGRRSGILVPRFGLNDIVRQDPGYNRQITNIGYYWAPNDYLDVTARLDWFSNRYVQYGVNGQYRWLDRFLSGSVGYNRQDESGGASSTNIRWDHRQNFNLTTSLNLSLNYASNTRIVSRNAVDPVLSTQQILSAANFSKRYRWGTLTLGGNRRQNLNDRSATMQLPALTLSPKPIDLGRAVTWSPGLTVTNDYALNTPLATPLLRVLPGGLVDTVRLTTDQRTTAVNLDTPLRLGGFNWRNAFSYSDRKLEGRQVVRFVVPDSSTPDPTDSLAVTRIFNGDFASALNWDTGINLPTLFRGSWKLQPAVGIANAVAGQPFMIRNRSTGGDWVRQGKRFSFSASATPTFFAFFPGFGPIERLRHSVSPNLTYSYSPAANINAAFARAIAQPGQPIRLRSDPTQTVSLGLSQNFEAKAKRAATDTGDVPQRKYRLLGIQTSAVQYDFEQARKPGRTGWTTQTVSNTFQSDLLPNFNLSLTHDLWRGQAGVDTSDFDPFLTQVSASFALSETTVKALLGLIGLGGKGAEVGKEPEPLPASTVANQSRNARPPSFYSSDQFIGVTTSRRFTANLNYNLSRSRPAGPGPAPAARQSLALATSFSPTPFWTVSWSTQYNLTKREFETQVVRLERWLHEWRAAFNFTRNANGNFAFFFSVYLSDLPDIKFDYNQTSIER
jgi:Tat protein translocase TatC